VEYSEKTGDSTGGREENSTCGGRKKMLSKSNRVTERRKNGIMPLRNPRCYYSAIS
jgi:hypothetical protein